MKYLHLILSLFILNSISYTQMTAKITLKEPIYGICDIDNIYSLMQYQDSKQIEATPKIENEELLKQLNQSLSFLEENQKYKGKGFVSIFVNCKGDLLSTKVYFFKGENKQLAKQLNNFFSQITKWNPGSYYGNIVDSNKNYSFKIKKGIITL